MENLSGTLLYVLVGVIGLLVGLLIASLFGRGDSKKRADLPKELKEYGFIEEADLWYSPALKSVLTHMDGEYFKDYNALSRDQKKKVYHLQKLWGEWAAAGKEPESQTPTEVLPQEAAASAVYVPVSQYKQPEPELEPYQVVDSRPPFSEVPLEVEQPEVDPLAELQRVALEETTEEVEPLQVSPDGVLEPEIQEEIPQPDLHSILEDDVVAPAVPEAMFATEPVEVPDVPVSGLEPEPVEVPEVPVSEVEAEPVEVPEVPASEVEPEPVSVLEEPAVEIEKEPVKEEPLTIAGQISKIMDEMLEGNPLKEKGVKLIENQKNGVDVWVGLEKFDGIGAVPYPEVQELIRNAVKRWEQESASKRN